MCARVIIVPIIFALASHFGNAQGQVERVQLPKDFYVFTFQEDKDGRIILGMSDGGVSGGLAMYHNHQLTILSGTDSIPAGSYHISLGLPDGTFLFGGYILGQGNYPTLVWVSDMGIDTLYVPFRLNNPMLNCFHLVNRRDIWIGTASGLIINRRGQWDLLTTSNGLPHNFVNTIHQDFRKIVWVGTERGLAYFLDNEIILPGSRSSLISSVTHLHSDPKGYLWAGARFLSEGVSVFNGKVWDTFTTRNGLADNSASVFVHQPSGELWVGSCYSRTRGGVSMFTGAGWNPYAWPAQLAKPCVDAIATDPLGRVWLGGSLSTSRAKGITIYDGISWHVVGSNSRLPADRVIAFFADSRGRMWISSFEGLFIVDGDVPIGDIK